MPHTLLKQQFTESSGGFARLYQKIDGAYRLTRIADANGNAITISFDTRGSLVGYTDARGKRTAFGYDHRGHLRTIDSSVGASLRLDYDRAGRSSS